MTEITIDEVPAATSYNVYTNQLGTWYEPAEETGSVCSISTWTDNGDGTITLDYVIPEGSWSLVTASTDCFEGSAGTDSNGVPRTSVGSWELCGASP